MHAASMREAMEPGKTLVFGHRGAMAYAPMNTLASFQLAYEQGADGIELDVHFSKDRQLIVLHDFTVDATTDGHGPASDFTLSDLKRLDAGSWFSPAFAGETIPTLDEVFDSVGGKLLMNIEIKSRFAEPEALNCAVADCIRRHKMVERSLVSSFDPKLLKGFRTICPDVMMGCLQRPGGQAAWVDGLAHEARHPWHEQIDAAYMNCAKDAGYFVNAWTVNDTDRACALKRLGVNCLITDNPARIIAALESC